MKRRVLFFLLPLFLAGASIAREAAASEAGEQVKLGLSHLSGEGGAKDPVLARQCFDKAAKMGSGEAMLQIGLLYAQGEGVAPDPEEALRWYRKAGEKKYAPAWNYIGQAYDQGLGTDRIHAEAFKWYRKAAEAGDSVGQFNLSVAYREGSGIAPSDAQALKWSLKAAEQSHPGALYHMGWFYHEGRGVERDYAKAAEWFRKAADAGELRGQTQLGQMYLNGKGVGLDYKEALKWLRLAAVRKEPTAMNTIGWCYERGFGEKKNLKQAASWYRDAAEAGDSSGQHNLGLLLFSGEGVSKDAASACDLFRKAAEQGNEESKGMLAQCGDAAVPVAVDIARLRPAAERGDAKAMVQLGQAFELGQGAPLDLSEARKWYRRAAAAGDAEGQALLGYMLRDGKGGEKDLASALKWSRKAAHQGHASAMADVGWAYIGGHGVKRSVGEAVKWFTRSVDAGNSAGQYNLGSLYFNGDGVAADRARGCELFRKAAEQGHPDAIAVLPQCGGAEPAAQAEAPKSDLETPSFRLAPRPSDFAVVVGIENYRRAPRADFAERDAAAAKAHFLAMGLPQRNIIHIAGEDATRSRLSAYLEEWLPRNVKPDSTVYFFYSGHGAPDAQTGQAYLLPADGDPSFLKTTAYPLKELYAALGKLKAKEVVVALDSCFSGAGGRSVIAQGARPLVNAASPSADTGRLVVFAAAQGEQITGGYPEQGHGLFTYHFLTGLAGAAKDRSGRVTTSGLFQYLKPLVEDEARRQNREQSPTLTGPADKVLVKF